MTAVNNVTTLTRLDSWLWLKRTDSCRCGLIGDVMTFEMHAKRLAVCCPDQVSRFIQSHNRCFPTDGSLVHVLTILQNEMPTLTEVYVKFKCTLSSYFILFVELITNFTSVRSVVLHVGIIRFTFCFTLSKFIKQRIYELLLTFTSVYIINSFSFPIYTDLSAQRCFVTWKPCKIQCIKRFIFIQKFCSLWVANNINMCDMISFFIFRTWS